MPTFQQLSGISGRSMTLKQFGGLKRFMDRQFTTGGGNRLSPVNLQEVCIVLKLEEKQDV